MARQTETSPGQGTLQAGKSVPFEDTTAATDEQQTDYGFPLGRGPAATPDPVPVAWEEPEDRAQAALSPHGDKAWVEDLIRPGRIIVIAAEEGTGKTMALAELGIRVSIAGGAFAGTWEVLSNGPVLYVSEMQSDEDYEREEMILHALDITRGQLKDKYFRQSLATGAGGEPVLDSEGWREALIRWSEEHQPLICIIDTATMATDAEPFGKDLRTLFRHLRAILSECPQMAIILTVHLRKPAGRGTTRALSDVMGEYGRWCDVVLLMENEAGLDRIRLTSRKRVKHQRRLIATKSGGLLIDPIAIDGAPTQKVSDEGVLAAIVNNPGINYGALAELIDVKSKSTVSGYVKKLEKSGLVTTKAGPRNSTLVYATDTAPEQVEAFDEGDEWPAA